MTLPPRLVQRIAVVGGASFVQDDVETFLLALHAKYPYATLVTGSAHRSCEPFVKKVAHGLGFKVEIPEPNYIAYGDEAMICQVNDVVMDADVIVTVGSPTGERAKRATEIHKRIDTCREPWNKRVLHNVGAPTKTAAKPKARRAKKKAEAYA